MTDQPPAVPRGAPTGYPITLDFEADLGVQNWRPLVNWLLAIPHLIVLSFIGIGVWVVLIISFFQVLFTGKWNEGMRNFVVGFMRWTTRVYGYMYFITDPYPPFTLQP